MQSALRSATRRAVAISTRRGVATTTTKAATATATAREPERDLVAENEKAWVAALVQREVRAQMVAEEERRITRDRLRAAVEESAARRCRLADEVELWAGYCACSAALGGWAVGAGLAILLFAR